jgi:methionyl-tRNA formyltransferase
MPKIVVFTDRLAYSICKGIIEIDRALPGVEWLVVLSSPRRKISRLVRNQWRNVRRNGWRWLTYQAAEVLKPPSGATRPVEAGAPGADYSRAALEALDRLEILPAEDLHAAATIATVEAFAPDLGLSLAAPILRRPLFSIPRLGTLNLHKGRLPDYRGMPPAFWELWNDEDSVGCTVHWVDDKLDTGPIVGERRVPRERFATLRALQMQLDEVGVELMKDAARAVFEGSASAKPQPAGGRTYLKPTLRQLAALDRKLRDASGERRAKPKDLVKHVAGKAAFPLWRTGLGKSLTPRITVLLYHRVSDEARDNLTVGVEQFDRQMRFVRTQCEPLTIEQVLSQDRITRTSRPRVCVTFDDGYLDNYTHAAPILLRHRVPAAFFVSTGIVATTRRFPHDVVRENPPIPVMSWDQLRAMHRQGFTIGSHSMSHIDCAAETANVVWNELVGSMDDLRRELGVTDTIFAYPYGGRQHMTAERLELVKRAGYVGCLSAYGGTNVRHVDPFNVLRRGIHWEFSDSAFALECLGLR